MLVVTPKPNQVFTITSAPAWPSVQFQTNAPGPHSWKWSLVWNGSTLKQGVVATTANKWDATSVITNCGGTLTVQVTAGNDAASVTVRVVGTNPTAADVKAYLGTKSGSDGFDKLLQHESGFRHFNAKGEPIKSYDNGYGMCQLTNPAPTLEQKWNWKLNVDGGLSLFAAKRLEAIKYLSQSKREYTREQLKYEAVCRWNGGKYHVWNSLSGEWVRNSTILCDSKTGNMGWDMTDPENVGKSEADLHKRDQKAYHGGSPAKGAHWDHYGVCYADAILGAPAPTPAPQYSTPPGQRPAIPGVPNPSDVTTRLA